MFIDKYREIIISSVHNIPQRLKQIDKGYFLVRNHETQQYEIHHREQIGDSFCLTIPYKELDERTLQRVRETRIEYIDKIKEEIKKNNEALEAASEKRQKDKAETIIKEVYRYCKKHESKETIDSDSKYFKEVV